MNEEKKVRVSELLVKLKKVNKVYQIANEEQRGRLLDGCEKIINDLVDEGYERSFVETLIIGGSDFVKSLGVLKDMDASDMAEVIFR